MVVVNPNIVSGGGVAMIAFLADVYSDGLDVMDALAKFEQLTQPVLEFVEASLGEISPNAGGTSVAGNNLGAAI